MRLEQLTFTRFLAAASIFIFHYGGGSVFIENENLSFIFQNANIGVSYFFILSGFVMIIAYGKKTSVSFIEYYRSRFARIYPLYFFALFLVIFVQLIERKFDFFGFLLNILMLQAWIPGKALSFNFPAWSLSVEVLFYLIFPFVFNRMYKKISLKRLSVYIVLFWVLTQIVTNILYLYFGESNSAHVKDFIFYYPLLHLHQFLVGNLAGLFFIKYLHNRRRNYDLLILVVVGLVILALKFPLGFNLQSASALLFVPLIILISLNAGLITQLFQKRIFVFLGEISFGVYILQYPVCFFVSNYRIKKYLHIEDLTIVLLIRLSILILVSSMTYIYLEKPILNKLKVKKKTLALSENPT
ncbi:acyltransferase family protein [Flavobacterium poyangense]|uniref:acyltransferase family protein n=1 Tax=Flavobacterium poyangense TaxID=2204302 RepID=UPI00141FAC1D|nr:acyltransferase [Flavobacterium sp. JXAS1]